MISVKGVVGEPFVVLFTRTYYTKRFKPEAWNYPLCGGDPMPRLYPDPWIAPLPVPVVQEADPSSNSFESLTITESYSSPRLPKSDTDPKWYKIGPVVERESDYPVFNPPKPRRVFPPKRPKVLNVKDFSDRPDAEYQSEADINYRNEKALSRYRIKLEKAKSIVKFNEQRLLVYSILYRRRVLKWNDNFLKRGKKLKGRVDKNLGHPHARLQLQGRMSIVREVWQIQYDGLIPCRSGYTSFQQTYPDLTPATDDWSSVVSELHSVLQGFAKPWDSEIKGVILSKIKSQQCDAGTVLGESVETYRMAASLIEGVKLLFSPSKVWDGKRGPLSGLTRSVFETDVRNQTRTMADLWLTYSFGIKPLIKSLVDLGKRLNSLRDEHAQLRYRHGVTVPLENKYFPLFGGVYFSGYCRIRRTYTFSMADPMQYMLSQLGLANPAVVAWELVPWSFVVDWVFPVCDFLAGFTSGLGLTHVRTWQTVELIGKVTRADMSVDAATIDTLEGVYDLHSARTTTGHRRQVAFDEEMKVNLKSRRELPLDLDPLNPSLRMPALPIARLANIAALLTQQILKR